jgi:hypothetical protein
MQGDCGIGQHPSHGTPPPAHHCGHTGLGEVAGGTHGRSLGTDGWIRATVARSLSRSNRARGGWRTERGATSFVSCLTRQELGSTSTWPTPAPAAGWRVEGEGDAGQ